MWAFRLLTPVGIEDIPPARLQAQSRLQVRSRPARLQAQSRLQVRSRPARLQAQGCPSSCILRPLGIDSSIDGKWPLTGIDGSIDGKWPPTGYSVAFPIGEF